MRNKGRRAITHLTVNGPVTIRRTVYGSKSTGWFQPIDQWLGIESHHVSPGVREMCCLEALDSSFSNVVRSLKRTAQLQLSEDRIRRIVESEGTTVQKVRNSNHLPASFTASDCIDGVVVTGADGVFVPVVPESQKQKRRETEAHKRLAEGRASTRGPGRPKKGADGDYQEAKILAFYSQDKSKLHVVSTLGNCHELGKMMRREGRKLQLSEATFSYSVADGAKWIERQYRQNLPMLDEHILDWYHFKEHVVTTSQVVYGESSPKGSQWQSQMLETAWDQGSLAMLHRLGPYERRHTDDRREALGSLRGYIEPRTSQTDYPAFRAQGYDCGSGPTESQCSSLTSRVDGPGMRWDRDNVQAMLALAALDHSNLWNAYWDLQRAA